MNDIFLAQILNSILKPVDTYCCFFPVCVLYMQETTKGSWREVKYFFMWNKQKLLQNKKGTFSLS
jgi:hypothetical protein